jgi:hypothetical protein
VDNPSEYELPNPSPNVSLSLLSLEIFLPFNYLVPFSSCGVTEILGISLVSYLSKIAAHVLTP